MKHSFTLLLLALLAIPIYADPDLRLVRGDIKGDCVSVRDHIRYVSGSGRQDRPDLLTARVGGITAVNGLIHPTFCIKAYHTADDCQRIEYSSIHRRRLVIIQCSDLLVGTACLLSMRGI